MMFIVQGSHISQIHHLGSPEELAEALEDLGERDEKDFEDFEDGEL